MHMLYLPHGGVCILPCAQWAAGHCPPNRLRGIYAFLLSSSPSKHVSKSREKGITYVILQTRVLNGPVAHMARFASRGAGDLDGFAIGAVVRPLGGGGASGRHCLRPYMYSRGILHGGCANEGVREF